MENPPETIITTIGNLVKNVDVRYSNILLYYLRPDSSSRNTTRHISLNDIDDQVELPIVKRKCR